MLEKLTAKQLTHKHKKEERTMIDVSKTMPSPQSTLSIIDAALAITKMELPSRKKSVSFAHFAEVMTVEGIEEYSQDEVHDMWWTREDYHAMQTTAASIVRSVRSTNVPVSSFALDARMAFRGLEAHIEHERVGKRISAALEAVLMIPFYEHDEQFGEADAIEASKTSIAELSETYSLYGQLALKEAHVQALIDELAVLAERESQRDEEDQKQIQATIKDVSIDLMHHQKETVDDDVMSDSSSSSSESLSPSTKATKRSRRHCSGDKSSSAQSSSSSSRTDKKRSSHKKRNKLVRRPACIFDTQWAGMKRKQETQ